MPAKNAEAENNPMVENRSISQKRNKNHYVLQLSFTEM